MTRNEFFEDVTRALRILATLGAPDMKPDIDAKLAAMKAGERSVVAEDLRRYCESIDWAAQTDAALLGELAQVLLRLLFGLTAELSALQ